MDGAGSGLVGGGGALYVSLGDAFVCVGRGVVLVHCLSVPDGSRFLYSTETERRSLCR